MRASKDSTSAALAGIWSVLVTAFVVAALYIGSELLIPLALAGLLTFLLSSPVSRLEQWIGRIASVLIAVMMLFVVVGVSGWFLTAQVIDLAAKLPDYQANIEAKLRGLRLPTGGALTRFSDSFEAIKKELPGPTEPSADSVETLGPLPPAISSSPLNRRDKPIPVRIIETQSKLPGMAQAVGAAVVGPLGTAGLVLLLLIFMLFKRDDLRGRIIRLVGKGHISATTHAMDDAGQRVSRYLAMQLMVNVGYGVCVAIGLFFVGVPNPVLWGAFAAALRFIPYIGPWIGAVIPVLLSFAVSTSWLTPLFTLGIFLILELVNANFLEPWLYGSSTGVSSIALIIAAVFWTWLWGPVGLILSTPLTVCLAVMGRHAPRLHFLSVLLSEERALAPHEECYHRLLTQGFNEAGELAETYLGENSLTALYDSVIIPTLTLAENDARQQELSSEQLSTIHRQLHDMIEIVGDLPHTSSRISADVSVKEQTSPSQLIPLSSVACIPARAYRDELAGLMLTQLLRQQGFTAENISASLGTGEVVQLVEKSRPDAVCISVIPPSTLIHARYLAGRLRNTIPTLQVVVGVLGATEDLAAAGERLRSSGADEVVVSLAEAVVQLSKHSFAIADDMQAPAVPANEGERLAVLNSLDLIDSIPDRNFDRITSKLTRLFEVPIALVSLIHHDQQVFKAQTGLPDDLAEQGGTGRDLSVCGHVVAANEVLIINDLARDRRFANNPLLKERGLRFYAGAPIRIDGFPIGSVCILDQKPRTLTEKEKRLLEMAAEDVVDEIMRRRTPTAV